MVEKNRQVHYFPCYHQGLSNVNDDEDEACAKICNAKVFAQLLKTESEAYMVFVLSIEARETKGVWSADTPIDVLKLKREEMAKAIWEVYKEYAALLPSNLPKGLPLVHMGHEF